MKKLFTLILAVYGLLGCGTQKLSQEAIPEHDNFKIKSKQLGETRVINIWTPPTYEEGSKSYPVLYMPDGGEKEDFPHLATTIAKLVEEKAIPPIILVGIENTVRGRDLTGYSESDYDAQYCPLTDGAKNFRAFIVKELFDEISRRYRLNNYKGLIGESLAGLFVMETLLQHPESFDFYIAFDPSLWWNNHYLVKNTEDILVDFPSNKVKLWFAGSSAEDISKHTIELAKIFGDSAPDNLIWKYSGQPKEKHHTIFKATKEQAIKWVLKEGNDK